MTTRKEEFEFDKEILAKTFSNVNAIGHVEISNKRDSESLFTYFGHVIQCRG
jgi:hypothetical protein